MRNMKLIFCAAIVLLWSCKAVKAQNTVPPYVPESKVLYDNIARMDSLWEDAYNHCKTDVLEQIISENIEFYHDQGGVVTSKERLQNAYKNNICGQTTRELLKGSIEVYPIKDYGAVEMGYHRFHNIHDNGQDSRYARFINIWHRENGQWRITRVISLHA